MGDVRTGAGVDGVPARVYLWADPIPDGWTLSTGRGRSLAGRGLPCCPGVLHVSEVVALVRPIPFRERERETYELCYFPVSLLEMIC